MSITRLRLPPKIMRMLPVSNKMRRVEKPTRREIRRSMNIWNLRSSEAEPEAVSAEIWRYGLKRVRIKEDIEKKSARLKSHSRTLCAKVAQPF